MKKKLRHILFVTAFLACLVCTGGAVQAAEKTVTVTNDSYNTVELQVGDTGQIVPSVDSSSAVSAQTGAGDDEYDDDDWYDDDWEDDDDWYDDDWEDETEETPVRYSYTLEDDSYWDSSEHAISIDGTGKFKALSPGTDTVIVYGYGSSGSVVFEAEVYFKVKLDMSQVSLKKTKVTGYLFEAGRWGNEVWYQSAQVVIPVSSPVKLDEDMYGVDLSCSSSSSKVSVYASLSDNKLTLELNASGKCSTVVTVSIGGKKFKINVTMQPVKIFDNSYLLVKGHSKKFTLSGYSGKVSWSSTNPKVASVSSSGVVKGKAIGNAVITAKIGDQRIGCAVSVTTAALKNVCERGTYIGTNWTYSQPKRTQNGYYDCSALVWKAYTKYTKINFGSVSYPGTTKTESAWCRDHKKLLKGGFSYKKIEKMQLNPGDIVFKSSDLKKPYTTTTHVEMFTGYACTGYDYNGNPIVVDKWAARDPGYGYSFEEGSILARPTK